MDGAWSVVLIVPRGTQLLMQKRAFISKDLNFPGGNSIEGENTPEETAARKLREETGLTVTPHDVELFDYWTGPNGQLVYAFIVLKYRGRPRSSVGGRVFWSRQYQGLTAKTSTFWASNERLIRKLLTMRPAA